MATVKVIASQKSWIEGEAIRQLENTANLPGMVAAWGLPGLHPGQGCPVDAVFLSEGRIFPHLVGSDAGCGMALWRISVKAIKPERIAKRLKARLEIGVDDPESYLEKAGVKPCGFESSLGTVGHGNHFAEILTFDEIRDKARAAEILGGFNSFMLVHSGSRGYGEQILYDHTAIYQGRGISTSDEDAAAWNDYWQKHNHACMWAEVNRDVIASRIFDQLGAHGEKYTESVHNFVQPVPDYPNSPIRFLHRKGAIPMRPGATVIPGSRGAHSYLVDMIGDGAEAGWSVSHGAGRKMSRKDARVKFTIENTPTSKLERTKFGSVVICEDHVLLMEEAPEVYKSIDRVIQDLVDHGLINVIALLKPVVTYKYRRNSI